MEQEENNLKDDFEKELKDINAASILTPEYKRKKTIIWGVRTIIAIILFVLFWKHHWVRWALIAYIPLNLFSLISIYGWSAILNKKIAKTKIEIDVLEEAIEESKNE